MWYYAFYGWNYTMLKPLLYHKSFPNCKTKFSFFRIKYSQLHTKIENRLVNFNIHFKLTIQYHLLIGLKPEIGKQFWVRNNFCSLGIGIYLFIYLVLRVLLTYIGTVSEAKTTFSKRVLSKIKAYPCIKTNGCRMFQSTFRSMWLFPQLFQ